jgi:cytochrome c biogenesis protein CcdA
MSVRTREDWAADGYGMGGASLRYLLLVLAILAVGLAGFIGFVVYPRFDLPPGAGVGMVGLAAAAGIASFFSPCSFPLLVTLLVRDSRPGDPRPVRVRRSLARAGWIGVGAASFVVGLGLLIAAGGAGLAQSVTFDSPAGRILRGVVGASLVLLGLIQIGRLSVNLRRFEPALHGLLRRQASLRRSRPAAGYMLFGFAYLAAGFG